MRHGLSQAQCEAEALFMFVAGSDTTSSVLRMTLFQVVACPRVYGRLKAEIATAVASGRVPTTTTTDNDDDEGDGQSRRRTIISLAEARALPYLQAVVYEGLRARPVTTGQQAKEVPAGGDVVRGVRLPAGTSVAINTGAMLRDPVLFGPDPDVFRPERFLATAYDPAGLSRDPVDLRRDVELAFGYGRYQCAGKPVAVMELNKVLFEVRTSFFSSSLVFAKEGGMYRERDTSGEKEEKEKRKEKGKHAVTDGSSFPSASSCAISTGSS